MSELVAVRTTLEHIQHVAMNMRDQDKAEVMASSGLEPYRALYNSVMASSHVWTGLVDDEPAFVFGVAPLCVTTGVGSPWLLGTDKIYTVRKQFIEMGESWVEVLLSKYSTLHNFVHEGNTASLRWLDSLGFNIEPAVIHGTACQRFHPFSMRVQ